jgi:ribosomal protein S18 acetylase RimI-like enzyme
MVPIDPETVEVFNLYVPEEKRRKGLGTELMKTIIKVARQQGYKYMQLHVAPGNMSARRIYEGLEFKVRDEELHMEIEL